MDILKNHKHVSILIFPLVLGMMTLLSLTGKTGAQGPAGLANGKSLDIFALGNEAYAKGDYDRAINRYQRALDRQGYTASLFYNLGNAYYMKNDIGQSILNYERALYLDPGNAHIERNLALARKNFGLATPHQASWKAFFNGLTLNGWTWTAAIALCAFSLMVFVNGIRPGFLRGGTPKMMLFVCCLLFMAAGTGMILQYPNLNRGVIIADNTRLRVSPFDSAAESGAVKNGKVVQLAKTYEGYILIDGDRGQSGWIPGDAVKAILPEAGNRQIQTSLTHSTIGIISGGNREPAKDKT